MWIELYQIHGQDSRSSQIRASSAPLAILFRLHTSQVWPFGK